MDKAQDVTVLCFLMYILVYRTDCPKGCRDMNVFLYFMPIDITIQKSLIIMAACPCAAVVLTFSELIGQGQDKACNIILLTTLLSVVTLPLICMLTDFILPS